jgi:hypothetical protein
MSFANGCLIRSSEFGTSGAVKTPCPAGRDYVFFSPARLWLTRSGNLFFFSFSPTAKELLSNRELIKNYYNLVNKSFKSCKLKKATCGRLLCLLVITFITSPPLSGRLPTFTKYTPRLRTAIWTLQTEKMRLLK